jgi:histidinol dehydrogenase
LGPDALEEAAAGIDRELLAALERAHGNIRLFHSKHLRESWEEVSDDGSLVGQRITPIESVGVYVPGGKAFYPSSVLMNIVPARVAGVREIVMVSPPSHEGSIHPAVLAAAKLAGADRVFRVGGAQAVAALAYGTESVPKVLKITGPGNAYVTAAKALVRSVCDIDTEAGPSEVTVIADGGANPRFAAFEMFAQAEHDEEASSFLLTTSEALAEEVAKILREESATLSRSEIIRASLESRGAIVVVRDLDEAVGLTNLIAPEHLAIYTEAPGQVLESIENAGAIMVGEMTTVAHGDYFAGPNHILPTGRQARFSSPLSTEDFRKVSSVISFSAARAAQAGEDVVKLATAEGLSAHAKAAHLRQWKGLAR